MSACIPAPPDESEPAIINNLDLGFKLLYRFFYILNAFLQKFNASNFQFQKSKLKFSKHAFVFVCFLHLRLFSSMLAIFKSMRPFFIGRNFNIIFFFHSKFLILKCLCHSNKFKCHSNKLPCHNYCHLLSRVQQNKFHHVKISHSVFTCQ